MDDTIPQIIITEITAHFVKGVLYNKKDIYFDLSKLPDDIAVGDTFFHIEHGTIVDIYDKNGKFKYGLFNFYPALIRPGVEDKE